jgi:beta-galactosidase
MKREVRSLDRDWRFSLGHAADVEKDFGTAGEHVRCAGDAGGAAAPGFDDGGWRRVDLPHDWAVELPFDSDPSGSMVGHGSKPLARTRPATSIGWYRRKFRIAKSELGQRFRLEFDGVYRDCVVWLNGHYLGRHMSGYASFCFDVTDVIHYAKPNVIAVRVDATLYEGWFYEGAGIYRHVRLVRTSPVHIAHWGTAVRSRVSGSRGKTSARLSILTEVVNESDESVSCGIESFVSGSKQARGRCVSRRFKVGPRGKTTVTQKMDVRNPALWSLEKPFLYRLRSCLRASGRPSDETTTVFGIRTVRFDPDRGFFLNGKPLKLKGVCCHQDHAGVGSALPDRIHEFRIELLKRMGANAYRCAHNPPSPEILDACDRLGMLVLDENRMMGSSEEILGQLSRMVLRDRNHPSIIGWSIGNEEYVQGTGLGARIALSMKRAIKRLDPTRPVTLAMNLSWGSPVSQVMDIQGCNYICQGRTDRHHRRFPWQPIMMSEAASTVSTRGIYENDRKKGYVSAYDANHPPWGRTAEGMWTYVARRRYVAGTFVWTGFDYRGEPTPYKKPCTNSHFGIIDLCGFPKDNFYYYKSWWGDEPVLHILPHWNWRGGRKRVIDVWCHSNCESVELFLNGESLGRKRMKRNSHLEWRVRYKPGELKAHGYTNGRRVATAAVETTGAPHAICLEPDRRVIHADSADVSMVKVCVVDRHGRPVPTASNRISFTVTGQGRLIGTGNGDPSTHEPDKGTVRRLFSGLCQAIVQSRDTEGTIRLTARSSGLRPATVTIRTSSRQRQSS